jgi:hypothetical protein
MEYLDIALKIITVLAPLAARVFDALSTGRDVAAEVASENVSAILPPTSRMELAMDAEHLRRAHAAGETDPAHAAVIDHALLMHTTLTGGES